MFTRQELIAELPRLAAMKSPPLMVVRYGQKDFTTPSSEESIWVCRGWKRDFANGLLFWVKAIQAQFQSDGEAYFRPYAEGGRCELLVEAEFAQLVAEHSGSLRKPLPQFLGELTGYRWGMRMHADWNEVSAVAELRDAFVAFSWSTSA